MNILQVVHRFLPSTFGGSEIYTYQLSKELNKRNDVCVLFTSRDLSKEQYAVKKRNYDGLTLTEIINNSMYGSFEETYRNSSIDNIFLGVLEGFKPDIIHIQHLEFLSANIIRLAKERGIPVVFTLHDFWLMCPREIRMKPDMSLCFDVRDDVCARCISDPSKNLSHLNRPGIKFLNIVRKYTTPETIEFMKQIKASIPDVLMKRYQSTKGDTKGTHKDEIAAVQERNDFIKAICSQVDMFISPSHLVRNEFIKFGIPKEKIIRSQHGHISGNTMPVRKKSSKLSFGFIGMITEHKGIDVLIKAFNRITDRDAELNIFGDNPYDIRYVKKMKKLSTNTATRFRGRFDHRSVHDVISTIDVLIMPAVCFENAPMTICEALMARTPVITSNLGGMAELVQHKQNGLLCNPGDPDDLYKKIMMIIDDRDLIERLTEGIKPVKSIAQDARDCEERYFSLLNHR